MAWVLRWHRIDVAFTLRSHSGVVIIPRSLQRHLRSYLLRVTDEHGQRRFLVQDLRTGERREFSNERELKRFLAEPRAARLR